MSTTTIKVTSLGSQDSASVPSAPNPTPATEAVDNDVMDPPPPMDLVAVTKILGPIEESLNESANEAMYPSPPINTPEVLSPAPSVVNRPHQTRGRGFSLIGARLAQLKIDERRFSYRDSDVASSNRSVEPSITEDEECDVASMSEVLSDGSKDKHGHGQGGSPTVNPRIEEYLSFALDDMSLKTPTPCLPSALVENTSSSTRTAVDNESLNSRNSMKSEGGVTEKSNWAEEVEDGVDRVCMRLEQLARDESLADPSMSLEEHYIARLERLLGSVKREVPVNIQKKAKILEE